MRLLRLLDVSNKYSFKCHYTHIKLAFSVGLTDWLLTCVAQRTGTAERTDSANTFLGQLIKLSGQRRRRNKTHLYQMVLLIRLLVLIWWSLAMPLCVLRCPLRWCWSAQPKSSLFGTCSLLCMRVYILGWFSKNKCRSINLPLKRF